ncbi:MAG: serine hydrolase domain-containing protein [Bacteroidota bacterium]
MKRYLLLLIIATIFSQCKKDDWSTMVSSCSFNEPVNTAHPKAMELQTFMDKYTNIGIPGISLAIYSDEGFWVGTSGYSQIENKTPMQPCHLQYSQSVSKTYMAVAILILKEKGKINLDNSISEYLPQSISSMISNAENITVRMLLNHTSGIAEYNTDPRYITYLVQHPLHKFSTIDYLKYIESKPSQFEPGSKYIYTNTNYLLLALIGDFITGDHAKFIRNEIFNKIGADQSFYHEDEFFLNKNELVNSYWDRYSNGSIENCTEMQKINVASMIGDDGMIAQPYDYVLFIKALFNGQLLADTTLSEMLTFPFEDEEGYGYGLGIHKELFKGKINYGHSGGGIGAGCFLTYFPETNTYAFIAINIGTSVHSPIFDNAENIVDDFYDILIE